MRCPHCNELIVTPLKYHVCNFFRIKRTKRQMLLITLLIVALVVVVHSLASRIDKVPLQMQKCHTSLAIQVCKPSRLSRMINYFKSKGIAYPEQMATAVLETNKPKLMAAVAVKEATPYTVKHGGYKKRHVGAWQVNEKLHGHAGNLPIDQALKAERILDELLKESNGDMRVALNSYGGDTHNKYAKNILKDLCEIP